MVIPLAVAAALLLAGVYALTTSTLARAATAFAALPLVSAGLLIWVALSDDHRGGRWERAEAGLVALFWVSLAALVLGALLLAYASRRDRKLFAFTAIALAIAQLLLVVPTMLGFSID